MQRMTRQRAAVAEVLTKSDEFRTAQQWHDLLRDHGHSVGLATVYRTMQTMAAAGDVDVLRNDEGEAMYRRCERTEHHHHLVCRGCGRTEEIEDALVERWAENVRRTYNFVEVEHTAELFGTCADCARRES